MVGKQAKWTAVFGLLLTIVAGVGAQVPPSIVTEMPTEVGQNSALLQASFTVGDFGWQYEQVLQNPGFELPGTEGALPSDWSNPVYLEGETGPSLSEFYQQGDYKAEGDFAAYMKYGSTAPSGWVGLAYEQTPAAFGHVDSSAPLLLSYFIRHQYSLGTGNISDHGGIVEVVLQNGSMTYKLRYFHLRHGSTPADTETVCYIDAGNPGWQTFTWYEHDLTTDVAQVFPELMGFTIVAVRPGIMMCKTAEEASKFYWIFDALELHKGLPGIAVYFQYREAETADWQMTSKTLYSADGVHAASITDLSPGTAYEFRAVLEYSGGTLYGDVLTFSTETAVYTLVVNVEPAESGTVSLDPEDQDPDTPGHQFEAGTVVTLTAIPATGWKFSHWTGEVADPNLPITTVTMDANKEVTAFFTREVYTLTIQVDPEGGGTTTPPVGNYTHYYGDVVQLLATPEPGWAFSHWAGPVADSTSPKTSVTIYGDTEVTAHFAQLEYTLTVNIVPADAEVAGCGVRVTPAGPYHYEDEVNLIAEPAPGWEFDHWSENVVLPDPTQPEIGQVTITGFATVTAVFALHKGDVNLDDTVDVQDVRLLLQAALGMITITGAQLSTADLNEDGKVDMDDVTILAEHLIGMRDLP